MQQLVDKLNITREQKQNIMQIFTPLLTNKPFNLLNVFHWVPAITTTDTNIRMVYDLARFLGDEKWHFSEMHTINPEYLDTEETLSANKYKIRVPKKFVKSYTQLTLQQQIEARNCWINGEKCYTFTVSYIVNKKHTEIRMRVFDTHDGGIYRTTMANDRLTCTSTPSCLIVNENKLVYCSNPIIRYPYDFADINHILPIITATAVQSDIMQPVEKVPFQYGYIPYNICAKDKNNGPKYKQKIAQCDCRYIDDDVSITDCPKDEYCPKRREKMVTGEWYNLPPLPSVRDAVTWDL
jgi:hypothetical protein